MVTIYITFENYSNISILNVIFGKFGNEYEYTENKIFRKKILHKCPICGCSMVHNGYNSYTKKGMVHIKIGKYICKPCAEIIEEDRSVWKEHKTLFINLMKDLYKVLKLNHVAYNAISKTRSERTSDIMSFIFPQSKCTIFREFNRAMGNTEIPPLENC